jgi:CRP-like cAMP-binding protein
MADSSPPVQRGNFLLASLPAATLAQIMPQLSHVAFDMRQGLYLPDTVIDAVYFPEAGMISLVSNLADGMRAEVGVIGREGVLGGSALSGVDTSFIEAMVQMPGSALRMSLADFRQEIEISPAFRAMLMRYNEALQAQIMQTAACNGRHALEQRLADRHGRTGKCRQLRSPKTGLSDATNNSYRKLS